MSSFGSLFRQWFRSDGAAALNIAARPSSRRDETYPPADPGLPAAPYEEVIAPHAPLLKRLHDAYGAEEDAFERDIVSVVKRYARFVHLLPATADSYFRVGGGLFRMGLEIAFYALQATDGVIFCGRQTITQRSALEPRWRYATFLAALCSELHRVFTHFVVTSNHGHEWPAYTLPLYVWLRETKVNRYHVRWHPQPPEARALAIVALTRIVSPETLQYLGEGNTVVVPSLVAALGATVLREANMLDQLVRRASALVIERQLHADVGRYGVAQLDASAEPHASASSGNPASLAKPLGQAAAVDNPTDTTVQVELALSDPVQTRLPSVSDAISPDSVAPRTPVTLKAPARLNPTVRDALQEIVATIDSNAQPLAAFVIDLGVFIPLKEFEARSVDPALAVRTLSDARMLASDPKDPRAKTLSRNFHDEPVLGVALAAHCVSGLDLAGPVKQP